MVAAKAGGLDTALNSQAAAARNAAAASETRAAKLMAKAEHVCLVSNSLVAQRRLEPTVVAG